MLHSKTVNNNQTTTEVDLCEINLLFPDCLCLYSNLLNEWIKCSSTVVFNFPNAETFNTLLPVVVSPNYKLISV